MYVIISKVSFTAGCDCDSDLLFKVYINPFIPNAPFLYPLKTLRFSDVFRGKRKGALGTSGLKVCRSMIASSKKILFHITN